MAVLTQRDVARLLKEHSAAARAETAAKIGAEFSGGEMDSSARKVAEEIFRMMLRDAEMRVRKELSESLKHSSLAPHAGASRDAERHDILHHPREAPEASVGDVWSRGELAFSHQFR
jgi:uncharacterized protein (DUF2336 family)